MSKIEVTKNVPPAPCILCGAASTNILDYGGPMQLCHEHLADDLLVIATELEAMFTQLQQRAKNWRPAKPSGN